MSNKDKILFFSSGDSIDPGTWSCVPFMFSTTLERRNFNVIRINYNAPKLFYRLYEKIVNKLATWLKWDHVNIYHRSIWAYYGINRRIHKAIKKHPDAICSIFMGYGYYNKWSKMPSILFSDTSYDWVIRKKLKRKPNWIERIQIKRDTEAIFRSALVINLFSEPCDWINKNFHGANVRCKKGSMANILYSGTIDETMIDIKKDSKHILFIGGAHYLEGAKMLIKAYKILKSKDSSLKLDFIALDKSLIDEDVEGVTYYGYLSKENLEQRELYYRLLINSKLFVNPTPFWGAYSSCIESMFFYTPIIVHPYSQFVEEFGDDIDFGKYNYDFIPEVLAKDIENLIYSNIYTQMAKNAHEAVKDYTWDNYVDWMFQELKKTDNAYK